MEPWQQLDDASEAEARQRLSRCCGSRLWVDRMIARRPFGSGDGLLQAARDVWFALDPADWLEAFSHHPKIGDRDALRARFASTRALSEREQSGVAGAREEVLAALAEGNAAYERRFGYIFIVCATGKSADEMLGLLRGRLDNDPPRELQIAAAEQAKITELRLTRLGSPAE
jgi:2-oxo-4-hydroxy-4-carboxy-5-ureidoimidazoline decarboxylase